MNHRIKSEIQSYYEFWFGLNEIYERWAKAHGITSNTLFVIHTINEYPDRCTPSVLCKCLLLSKQTVNSILNRLERDGYISRHPSPSDGRCYSLALTGKGHRMLSHVHEEYGRIIQDLKDQMGNERFSLFLEMIEESNEILRKNL